jgi:hypothetical protein
MMAARAQLTLLLAVMLLAPAAYAAESNIPENQPAPLIHHSPINPHRRGDGSLMRSPKNQLVTNNWSGYEVANFQTQQTYNAAAASWQVPTVTYGASTSSSNVEYASLWLGIGGYCENAGCTTVDQTLIQLGTDQIVSSSGGTNYYAWYEMLPEYSVQIPHPVHPGDVINASIQCVVSCTPGTTQTWTMTMADTTAGWNWTQNFQYATTMLSAEWIVEAPYGGGVLPLSDYRQATFEANSANGSSPVFSFSSNGIVMYDPWGQTSNPASPSGASFSTCWGSGSLAPCTTGAFGAPPPSAPTDTLVASPTSITAGQAATLTWNSTNATSCAGAGFAASSTGGSTTVKPAATSTYSITCSGSGGSTIASTTVTVATTTASGGGKHHVK